MFLLRIGILVMCLLHKIYSASDKIQHINGSNENVKVTQKKVKILTNVEEILEYYNEHYRSITKKSQDFQESVKINLGKTTPTYAVKINSPSIVIKDFAQVNSIPNVITVSIVGADITASELNEFLKKCGNSIVELHLPKCNINSEILQRIKNLSSLKLLNLNQVQGIEIARLNDVLSNLEDLEDLHLSGCGLNDRSLEILSNKSCLKRLEMADCKDISARAIENFLIKLSPNYLEYLDLRDTNIHSVGELVKFRNLKVLFLSGCTGIPKGGFISLFSSLKKLEHLWLNNTHFGNKEEVEGLKHCEKLFHFIASSCPEIEIGSFENVFSYLTALDKIDLTKTNFGSRLEINQLKNLSKLKKLYLSQCKNIPRDVFGEVLNKLSSLEVFDVEYTNFGGKLDLKGLSSLNNLVELHLKGCLFDSEDVFHTIIENLAHIRVCDY